MKRPTTTKHPALHDASVHMHAPSLHLVTRTVETQLAPCDTLTLVCTPFDPPLSNPCALSLLSCALLPLLLLLLWLLLLSCSMVSRRQVYARINDRDGMVTFAQAWLGVHFYCLVIARLLGACMHCAACCAAPSCKRHLNLSVVPASLCSPSPRLPPEPPSVSCYCCLCATSRSCRTLSSMTLPM